MRQFANLRVFSGSNHVLLPTGLLFGAPQLPTMGGGVLWVESTPLRAALGPPDSHSSPEVAQELMGRLWPSGERLLASASR